jgi:hypothetical protein
MKLCSELSYLACPSLCKMTYNICRPLWGCKNIRAAVLSTCPCQVFSVLLYIWQCRPAAYFQLCTYRLTLNFISVRAGPHQGNWQSQRNRNFRELLSAWVEHVLLNGAAPNEETALSFPQYALLHLVTCVQLRLITILGNWGCVAVNSFLGVPSPKRVTPIAGLRNLIWDVSLLILSSSPTAMFHYPLRKVLQILGLVWREHSFLYFCCFLMHLFSLLCLCIHIHSVCWYLGAG